MATNSMYINDSASKQPKPGTKSTIQELEDRPPLFTLTQSLKTKSTETSSDEDYEPDDTVTPKISNSRNTASLSRTDSVNNIDDQSKSNSLLRLPIRRSAVWKYFETKYNPK